MKNLAMAVATLFISQLGFSQTKQDYRDYIKSHSEASPSLGNYVINIGFGSDLAKVDASTFAGKTLTEEEYQNIIFVNSNVYLDNSKSQKFFEVVRSADLRGVRKVSTLSKSNDEGAYFEIIIYINDGFLCKEWSSPNSSTKPISSISINVRTDETTATNIKKAMIALAKLCGPLM
jgi:hypothetical protein